MSMTLLLQDEKGAFNFDQKTVINPETGEQVRAALADPQGAGRVNTDGVAATPKPASWASPSRFRAGTGAGRPGTASSAPSPPATKSAEPRVWASTSASTPKCWSMSSRHGGGPLFWAEGVQEGVQGGQGTGSLGSPLPPPSSSPRIFGFEGADAEDVIYVNWLNMVRAGLLALEFYTPEASNWRQVGAGRSPQELGSLKWGPGSGFWV